MFKQNAHIHNMTNQVMTYVWRQNRISNSHIVYFYFVLVVLNQGLFEFWFENRVPLMRSGSVRGVASFVTIDEQLENRGCYIPHASCASCGLFILRDKCLRISTYLLHFTCVIWPRFISHSKIHCLLS